MNLTIKIALIYFTLIICTPAFALSFPLPKSNFSSAKMPMHVIYPRPDSETQPHARHRWAHPDFRYEIPIGVQGGAWPFKYEIISGPAGATIGQYYGDADYGVLKWMPNINSGSENFLVRVTDQELNTVDLTWTTTVDANQFVFIQDGYTGTKLGTITQPLESFADWYKGDRADKTYHNKIIVFRSGNYVVYGAAETNGNVRLDTNSKTPTLIGYPDEWPILDMALAKIFTDTEGMDDLYFSGLRFENARSDVANSHFIWAIGSINRATWFNNYFYNLGNGTSGGDNPSGVFISDTGADKQNILIKRNTFDAFTNNGPNGSYTDIYRAYYVLIEENTAKNSNNGHGWWAKATKAFVTIRANNAFENITNGGIIIGYQDEGTGPPHDHEVCWNRIKFNSFKSPNLTLQIRTSGDTTLNLQQYNSFIYRNTFVNGSAWVRFAGNIEPYKVDANVIVTSNSARWNTSIMVNAVPNIVGSNLDNITDNTGALTGVYRSQYLGLIGHELSSKYITTPNGVTALDLK